MYFQETYWFFLYYLTCANLEIGPSAASLAWSTFSGKFQDSPESLKVTVELIVYRFIFVLEHNTNGKKFGSQQLLIERLLGCSLGIKLTPILPRGIITTIRSPNVTELVFLENQSIQLYSNGSVLFKLPMFSHSSRGQLLKLPVHTEPNIIFPGHSSPKVLVSSTAVKSFS